MRNIIKVFVCAAFVFGVAAITIPSAPSYAAGKDTIEKRRAMMKEIGKNWKVIKKVKKSQDNDGLKKAAKAALKMNALGKEVFGLFPKGTGRGDFDAKTTRALPAIWEDMGKFKAIGKKFVKNTKFLAEQLNGGDWGDIGVAFTAVGKKGCGACHKSFRGKKVKKK